MHTVMRTTTSGAVHGASQAVELDQALRAITINGAYQLKRVVDEVTAIDPTQHHDLAEHAAKGKCC